MYLYILDVCVVSFLFFFFFSSRRRHTRCLSDWSSDVCSSDLAGAVFGLFLAGYTGVLLSVSNQPIWSDTWALGALFLASGLSVAAAALSLVSRLGRHEPSSEAKLTRADRYFIILELALIVVFFLTLGAAGSRFLAHRWMVLWAIVAIGTLVPLALHFSTERRAPAMLAAVLTLAGGLALRMVVVFGAQM